MDDGPLQHYDDSASRDFLQLIQKGITPNLLIWSTSKTGGEEAAKKAVPLDASQPSTNVQIRLVDDTRLVATLKDTHTIRDIRNYIVAARPEYEGSPFMVLSTFPHRELEDEKASPKDANLLNTVIVQRLK